jgi:hypothetical protein
MNDVWYSWDGTNWIQALSHAPWSPRVGHSSLAFDGKMWVFGGTETNDVWRSPDGIHWTTATSHAAWSPRSGHSSVMFGGKMWVLGGNDGTRDLRDVWYSTDGAKWTSATANLGAALGFGHQSVVHSGKIWAICRSSVWSSADGANWTRVTAAAPWGDRGEIGAAVCDGRIWVMGGATLSPFPPYWPVLWNDVWYSTDGATWRRATSGAPWLPRTGFTVVADRRGLWLLGGLNYYYVGWEQYTTYLNDVWYSELPAETTPAWKLYP